MLGSEHAATAAALNKQDTNQSDISDSPYFKFNIYKDDE